MFYITLSSILVNSILKMGVRLPRPFFYETEYKPPTCSFEYGNPSGHGQCSASLYLSLVYLLIGEFNITSKLKQVTMFILAFGMSLFVGYTRIFTGLHTLDQIVTGIICGTIVFLGFAFFLKRPFLSKRSGLIMNPVLLTCIGGFALLTYLFYFNQRTYPEPTEWNLNAKTACPNKELISFDYNVWKKGAMAMGMLGVFYGSYLRRHD